MIIEFIITDNIKPDAQNRRRDLCLVPTAADKVITRSLLVWINLDYYDSKQSYL